MRILCERTRLDVRAQVLSPFLSSSSSPSSRPQSPSNPLHVHEWKNKKRRPSNYKYNDEKSAGQIQRGLSSRSRCFSPALKGQAGDEVDSIRYVEYRSSEHRAHLPRIEREKDSQTGDRRRLFRYRDIGGRIRG